jgi:hypothetical protein
LVYVTETEHPDSLKYKHVIVSHVRVLYYDGIIQFQQDHSSLHDSVFFKSGGHGMLMELSVWPLRVPNMNTIENMWSEVKKTMQEI